MVQTLLLLLQSFQVAFLWTHDWVPLGRLNDVRAVRHEHSPVRIVVATFIQSVPFTILLILSASFWGQSYPGWLVRSLWVAYAIMLIGELRAWWVPYLFREEPELAASYRVLFGDTHSFLPLHNGLAPNTAHVLLHVCTAATLVVLFLM